MEVGLPCFDDMWPNYILSKRMHSSGLSKKHVSFSCSFADLLEQNDLLATISLFHTSTARRCSHMGSCCIAGLQQVVTNFEKSKESLSGPVAIVAVGAEVARSDVANLFQFAAILNINLAVINILPLPVRYPGHLACCCYAA